MAVIKTVKIPAYEFQWNLILYPHSMKSVRTYGDIYKYANEIYLLTGQSIFLYLETQCCIANISRQSSLARAFARIQLLFYSISAWL